MSFREILRLKCAPGQKPGHPSPDRSAPGHLGFFRSKALSLRSAMPNQENEVVPALVYA